VRFAPTVVLSHRTPTVSFNISAFNELSQRDLEIEQIKDADTEFDRFERQTSTILSFILVLSLVSCSIFLQVLP
jgi:hypothetical protein